MRNFISSIVLSLISTLSINAQWELAGKVTTGSQFELTHTGKPVLTDDNTKIHFIGGGFFSTYDIETNTLSNFTRKLENGDQVVIDYQRNRILSIAGNLKIHDYNTFELINEITIPLIGGCKLLIDSMRDELIVVDLGIENNSSVAIYNLNDYSRKHDFSTSNYINTLHQVILDHERSKLYLFYVNPNEFEVYNLNTLQFDHSAAIPGYYISPLPVIDYKNDRIILIDYGWSRNDMVLVDLIDHSLQNMHLDHPLGEFAIDTISNRIWDGGNPNVYGRDLNTIEIIETIIPPKNYFARFPFSCPKYNYLYGMNGNYVLIFDLQTHAYLGKVKVGASPSRIVVDHLQNTFYTKEIQNPELTLFSDYLLDNEPYVVENIEIPEGFEGGFEIIPDNQKIIYTGLGSVSIYDYQNKEISSHQVPEPKEVEIDRSGKRIFAGTSQGGPGNPVNHLYAFNYDLNLLWKMTVPWLNADLEYDNEKYLYYHSRKTWGYAGFNKTYKIDTDTREIVDSIELGFDIRQIEYSQKLNRLYALNVHNDSFPSRLYIIDCEEFICEDSIDINGLRGCYLADSLDALLITHEGEFGIQLQTYDIISESIVSKQYLPDGINPLDITMNPLNNILYIVDQTIGGVYKYRNAAFPSPDPPVAPDPPGLLIGDNQIELSWDRIDTIVAYNLYRKKGNEEWQRVTFEPIIDTFYKDLQLINNIEYTYALSLLGEYYIEGIKSLEVAGIPIDLPDFELSNVYSDNMCSKDGKKAQFNIGINKESNFNDTINFVFDDLPEGINAIIDNPIVFEENIISIEFEASAQAQKGIYEILLTAQGGGQTHNLSISLRVIDEINIAIDYHPKELKVGDWISIEGSTYPLSNKSLIINISSSVVKSIVQDTIFTDSNGIYKTEYIALSSDTISLYADLLDYNYASDTIQVFIGPGDANVSCISDINDSTEIGWNVQVTGQVFPNPGSGTIQLHITSPFDSVQIIDNIPLNEFGYYGHSFNPDTSGLWEIIAQYSGSENYTAASSFPNLVPIGVKSGYSIIFVGDVSDESNALDTTFRKLGKYAYNTLVEKHLGKEEIYILFPDQSTDLDNNGLGDDVDEYSSANNLKKAINWAKINIQDSLDLNLYVVSQGEKDSILMNGDEFLLIDSLDIWLDDFSNSHSSAKINIIIENSFGKEYINKLSGSNRRVITSTNDSVAYFFNYGDISFSGYFWNYILQGGSIGEAFIVSKSVINSIPDIFYNQESLIDANGNQIQNEQEDFNILSEVFIGYGTRIDNFAPEILGSTIDTENSTSEFKKKKSSFTTNETAESNLYLSVLLSSATENLETVYAVLIGSDNNSSFKSNSNDQLPDYKIYELSRYENSNYYLAAVDKFIDIGNYTFIVYASDYRGLKADPKYCQFSIVEILGPQVEIEGEIIRIEENIKIYPNPISSRMTIKYELSERSVIMIKLYNESGVLIDIVDNSRKHAGIYSYEYNTDNLSEGIYFVSIEVNNTSNNKRSRVTRKVICIK